MLRKHKLNNRVIENTYKMLKYLYVEMNSKRFGAVEIDKCNNLLELYALVISNWALSIAKEGLYKEYINIEGKEMTSPIGQIDIQETINRQTKIRGSIVCNYDELNDDIYINQVVKSILYEINKEDVNEYVRKYIKKTLQRFNGITVRELKYERLGSIKYTNSNIRYKNLINFCRSTLEENRINASDEDRGYIVFKKQLIKYIASMYPDLIINSFQSEIDDDIIDKRVLKIDNIIVIRDDEKAILISVRLQDKDVKVDAKDIRNKQEYILRLAKQYYNENKLKTTGAIVYANMDIRKINIEPLTTTVYDGFMIIETVVDVFDHWRYIESKIAALVKVMNFKGG